jgi:hypothetical protein
VAKTHQRSKAKAEAKPLVSPLMIGIVVAAAVLVVVGLVMLGNWGTTPTAPVELSQFPNKGQADAPVTIVEFSDYG